MQQGDPTTDPRKEDTKILIIEDCEDIIALLEMTFTKMNCTTIQATSTQYAVESLLSHQFDLIILDWLLIGTTGEQTILTADKTLNSSKEKSLIKPIPIILYTGVDLKKIKAPMTQNFEIKGVWKKPIPYSELRACAKQTLSHLKA